MWQRISGSREIRLWSQVRKPENTKHIKIAFSIPGRGEEFDLLFYSINSASLLKPMTLKQFKNETATTACLFLLESRSQDFKA